MSIGNCSMDSMRSGIPTSTTGAPKFTIQQSIPCGCVKKGPYAIVRSANLYDAIEIKRRYGEGSKPLFARDDIAVNQTTTDSQVVSPGQDKFDCNSKSNRSSSTDSSSVERYRHRENKKQSSPSGRKLSDKPICSDKPNNNRGKDTYVSKFINSKYDYQKRRERTVEKLPYYRDEQREKERLRRLYGRSRSRSPPLSSSRRRRSLSRHSPYRTSRRDYSNRRSRTRSPPRRERSKHSLSYSKDHDKGHKENSSTTVIPATPQYIPIPVAVPADYAAYSFPGWTSPQPPWHTSHRPPGPPHFAPVPMWPMIPPIRPPHQAPYGSMIPGFPYTPSTSYRPSAPVRCRPPGTQTSIFLGRKKP